MTGIVFDIQRFSLHDGPGIRTTVFLKGCSARCAWCHNPESFSMRPELQYYKDRCTGCGKCVHLCPNSLHTITAAAGKQTRSFNRSQCTGCGICAAECFTNALVITGREESVENVMRQVMADLPYYEESGGGVTLSGGEPVLQGDFCEELLRQSREKNVHTNIQTAGFYRFEMLERLLPFLDLVMYDIKAVSPDIYSNYIFSDYTAALENLTRLDRSGTPFIVRMPCVKGINDTAEEIEAVTNMLGNLKNMRYLSFLPYHNLARIKYDVLGMEFKNFEAPSKEQMEMLNSITVRFVKTG